MNVIKSGIMKIGVLSDTHGNLKSMFSMADLLLHQEGVELFFHLGDDYADGEALSAGAYPVRFVPGLWCAEYHKPLISKYIVTEIEGIRIALAHTLEEARRNAADASIYLFGHTHAARIEKEGKQLLFNPGHLKERNSRGQAPSAGLLEISSESVRAAIIECSGKIRFEKTVNRAALA